MAVLDRVREQTKLLEQQIPELMKEHAGEWVLFQDGQVLGFYADESTPYVEGAKRFGLEGGFVIARVEPMTEVPLSAAHLFGLLPT
jgi:hypothetical protein